MTVPRRKNEKTPLLCRKIASWGVFSLKKERKFRYLQNLFGVLFRQRFFSINRDEIETTDILGTRSSPRSGGQPERYGTE
jgi:hypothetical protein